MEDEITLSGALLRKFATKVFDAAFIAALEYANAQIKAEGTARAMTEKEYAAFRTATLAKVEVV